MNTPNTYNDIQSEEIQKFISNHFGDRDDCIVHEIVSEYVQTDTMMLVYNNAERVFVTFGMGARIMDTPKGPRRCELVMVSSNNLPKTSKESFIIAGELTRISKFPFREDTWLGTGHTLDTSKQFKETFGYDYFAFMQLSLSAKLTGIGEDIDFLLVIPIYAEERQWCMDNHTLAYLDKLSAIYEGHETNVDFKRDLFLPENMDSNEIDKYNVMTYLGLTPDLLEELCAYMQSVSDNGSNITYDVITKWFQEKGD